MDDLVSWLFGAACDWFADAAVEATPDPDAVAAGVAAAVLDRTPADDPGLLTRGLAAAAYRAGEGVAGAAAEAVHDHLADRAAAFLTAIPDHVRATFARPDDPAGLTVPPGLARPNPADLAAVLGGRPARFRPGDRPLPGVDLELVRLLGVGGCGEVWEAKNPHLFSAPAVALKFCTDPAAARLLRHEAAVLDRVLRAGEHPGVVGEQDDCRDRPHHVRPGSG